MFEEALYAAMAFVTVVTIGLTVLICIDTYNELKDDKCDKD